jgi:hypothetical protein
MAIADAAAAANAARKQHSAAKSEQQRIEDERERALWMSQKMDWTPEYASKQAPTFKRSESPVGDAFLDSFLMGTNPMAIKGTMAGAPAQKAVAQQRFNRQTGGWDALRAREAALEKETPWAVTAPTREINKPDIARETFMADQIGYLSPAEIEALERAGLRFKSGRLSTKSSGPTSIKLMRQLGLSDSTPAGQAALRSIAREIQGGREIGDILSSVRAAQQGGASRSVRIGAERGDAAALDALLRQGAR